MGLFTPAWKGKNDEKAFKFIDSCSDEAVLKRIAAEAPTDRRKAAALEKIRNQIFLFEFAMAPGDFLSCKAVKKITDETLLIKVMEGASSGHARVEAVKRIEDQPALIKAARNYADSSVSSAAIPRIRDRFTRLSIAADSPLPFRRTDAAKDLSGHQPEEKEILVRLAVKDPDPGVRALAVGRLYDQELICSICRTDQDAAVREAAVKALEDQDRLEEIIRTCSEERLRNAAIARITDPDKRLRYEIQWITDRKTLLEAAGKLPEDHPLLTEIALKKGERYDYGWHLVGEAAVKKIRDRDALMRIARETDNINVRRYAIQKLSKEDLIELTGTAAGKAAYEELDRKHLLDGATLDIIIAKHVSPASGFAEDEKEERHIRKTLEKIDPELMRAYDRRDADVFMKKPCKETVYAAVFMLKRYGKDDYYGYGPSPAAYGVARFLSEVYRSNPELRENLKEANKYSIESHIDQGSASCHTDEGPLIFNY